MTTKDQAECEAALRAETELLGNVHSINRAVQGLANVVEFENQRFGERLQRVEVQLSQLFAVVRRVVEHLEEDRADDWWKGGNSE